METNKQTGFTLIELLVVVSIISLLSSVAMTSVRKAEANGRDSRRIADVENITKALYLDYLNNGKFDCQHDYDKTFESGGDNEDFLKILVTHNVIARAPIDPLNDATYHYSYTTFHVPAGPGNNPPAGPCGAYAYLDYTTENPITSCVSSGVLIGNNHCHIFLPERPPCSNKSQANKYIDNVITCNSAD